MSDSTQWAAQWNREIQHSYATPGMELVSGHGCTLTDNEGKEYLDFLAGIAVNALGQAHPAVIEAVTEQMQTLGHVSNIYAHEQVLTLAHTLQELVGNPDAQVFFANSGAEANEAAFKLARLTDRPKILAAKGGFHGRTMGALALTGQPAKQDPFKPLPAGVEFYDFGDIDSLRELADENTAAIFLESIQGEVGVITPPDGFLGNVRALCDELGILMVVDEVQAGMGRTGQWFGYQHEDITPDIVTLAKGLGGGLPIGATIAMPSAQKFQPGMHGTTFGGNPVVCAAGNAVIETIRSENLLSHATEIGDYLKRELSGLPEVAEVRGCGLMLGVVTKDPVTLNPADYGLLLNQIGTDVLRLVPPLVLTQDEAQHAVTQIGKLLHENAQQADR